MTGSTPRIPAPQTSVTRWQGAWLVVAVTIALAFASPAVARGQATTARGAAPLTLMRLVDPATRVEMNARMVPFALHGFGTVTLEGYADGRLLFLSSTYQDLMLEIWKVKYLQMPRDFRRGHSQYRRSLLDHFLDDGDSPDIPIPIYVKRLNRIRDLALAQRQP